MSSDRIFEEQPLRCMANYYDYGPQASAPSVATAYSETTPQRPVPGPMANYTENITRHSRSKSRQLRQTRDLPDSRQRAVLNHISGTRQNTHTGYRGSSMTGEPPEEDSYQYKRSASQIHLAEMTQLSTKDLSQSTAGSATGTSSRQLEAPHRDNIYRKTRRRLEPFQSRCKRRLLRSRFYGWRMGVLLGVCVSTFVLLCNIAVIVVGGLTEAGYDQNGVSTVMSGSEATVSAWNSVYHVFINVLSTILLSASNYTMQVLNSPTRQEMDKAQRSGRWLDIGLLSIHNLKIISRKRAVLCLLLASSSLPLHLFYNASIFKIIAASDFEIVMHDRNTTFFSYTTLANGEKDISGIRGYEDISVRLDNGQWARMYNAPTGTPYGDLHLVVDQVSWTLLQLQDFQAKYNRTAFFDSHMPSAEGWASYKESDWKTGAGYRHGSYDSLPAKLHIVEGWTYETGRKSRIQISLYFMIVVVSFNLVKLAVMVSTLLMDTSDYIVILGDAAASYLERPEEMTEDRGELELDRLLLSFSSEDDTDYSKVQWQPRLRRYCSSIGYDKAWTAITAGICLVLVLVIFPTRINALDTNIWKWGSASGGSLSFGSRAGTTKGTIWNAWLANMPQVLLSMCYLNLNTLCSSMASAAEWNNMATSRKGLRVTNPRGDQRSKYFLQLPYKFAVPLIFASGGLHWLLSQTFFLSRTDFFNRDGELDQWTSACGISFSSLSTFRVTCAILVFVVRWVGRRRMVSNLPLAENCSLMISAACHPDPTEVDPHLAKVQWGIIPSTGRCSLSSRDVKQPEAEKP